MMPNFFCFVFSILFASYGHSQIRGTLVIAAIGNDGIMIAADSRVIFGTHSVPLAYYDSFQKITTINKYPVAISGLELFGDKEIQKVVDEFNKKYTLPTNIQTSIQDFIAYLDNTDGNDHNYDSNQYVGAAYYGAIPEIIGISKILAPFVTYNEGSLCSNPKVKSYFRYDKNLPCKQLGELAEYAIFQFAEENHLTNEIGGPISIIQITPDNKVKYLKNDLTKFQFPDFHSFIEAFRSGKVHVTYIGNSNKKNLLDFFNKY